MERRLWMTALVAACAAGASNVFAQGPERRDRDQRNNGRTDERQDRDRNGPSSRNDREYNRDRDDDRRSFATRERDRRRHEDWSRQRNLPRYHRGAGPTHSYYAGGRLPPRYATRHYVVNDWRGHGLNAPPRGYHWVQTGSDYVLIAIATGVILQLLLRD